MEATFFSTIEVLIRISTAQPPALCIARIQFATITLAIPSFEALTEGYAPWKVDERHVHCKNVRRDTRIHSGQSENSAEVTMCLRKFPAVGAGC